MQNRAESSLVAEVKENQFVYPLLAQLKEGILKYKTTDFSFGMNDGTLWHQNRLCVPDIDGLRERIMAEAHTSRYSVHPGSTKIYHDLKEINSWNNMKIDVADFVAKRPNCQQVVGDPSIIVPVETMEVNEELSYEEVPVAIFDRQVRKLRNKEIPSVKVLWQNQQVEEATWEADDENMGEYEEEMEAEMEENPFADRE
ncbi:uncharacterized protein [Nicotiana sylvestris]|uniref:uncharacterized protein n=1 Tax=Nicotiana sylvestris TaxID=4096 RepID=UPI00388CE825